MKQRLLIAVLCAAMCSCTKENPVPVTTSVPLPWRVSGVTPQTSTYSATKQVDCNNTPPPAPKPSCNQHQEQKPVGIGFKKDTSCRNIPAPPKTDSCCR
jgi:hypothetical protein